jgi:uncharacterized integral membrane protein
MLLRERHAQDLARPGQPGVIDDREASRIEPRRRGWPSVLGFLAGALLASAVVLLIVQNSARVEMEWLQYDVDGPLWMFIGLSFAAGFLSAPLLLGAFRRARARRRDRNRGAPATA